MLKFAGSLVLHGETQKMIHSANGDVAISIPGEYQEHPNIHITFYCFCTCTFNVLKNPSFSFFGANFKAKNSIFCQIKIGSEQIHFSTFITAAWVFAFEILLQTTVNIDYTGALEELCIGKR
jgi:hypothetical protein